MRVAAEDDVHARIEECLAEALLRAVSRAAVLAPPVHHGDNHVRARIPQLLHISGVVCPRGVVDAEFDGARVAVVLHAVGGLRVAEHAQLDAVDLDDVGRVLLRLRAVGAAVGEAGCLYVVQRDHQAVVVAVEYVVIGQRQEVYACITHGVEHFRRGVEERVAGVWLVAVEADGGLKCGDGVVCLCKGTGD